MFYRQERSGKHIYLRIVENRWEDGRSKQRVIVTLGRLDELREQGRLDGLLRSGAKFSQSALLLTAQQKGELPVISTARLGPELIFQRPWSELKIPRVLEGLLGDDDQDGATSFAPRCIKDQVEEGLFHRRRDLFSELALVFYDTTSIYFEGRGGETLGEYGHSKDHRPDRLQMVVGVVLDGYGRPLCCELWPGNTTDVKTLPPIVDQAKKDKADREAIVAALEEQLKRGDKSLISSRKQVVRQMLEQNDWRHS